MQFHVIREYSVSGNEYLFIISYRQEAAVKRVLAFCELIREFKTNLMDKDRQVIPNSTITRAGNIWEMPV